MQTGKKTTLLIGGLIGVFAIGAYILGVLWQASRAAKESARELHAASEIGLTSARLDRPPSGAFGWFSSPALFTDAVSFHNRLYICGPAGRFEYDAAGVLKRRFRPALECLLHRSGVWQ